MHLKIGNVSTKVESASQEEIDWLMVSLSYKDSSSFFRRGKKKFINLFSLWDLTFPSGLASVVLREARKKGFSATFTDMRTCPTSPDPMADLAWLRDYQKDAVETVVKKTRGILWHCTGAGKTETVVGLTRRLPCRWVLLVNSSTLMHNAAERWERRHLEHTGQHVKAGRCGDGIWEISDTFTAATFQTVARSLDGKGKELMEAADGLMIDECHTLPAESFYRTVGKATNAYYRVGFSGTPLARGDKKSIFLVGAIGSVIHRVKPETLISRGLLARPTINLVTVKQESTKDTWQKVYKELIVDSSKRNAEVTRLAMTCEKPAIVFVKEIAHGNNVKKALEKARVKTKFIHGSHSTAQRDAAVERLVRGDLDVLVVSTIFDVGVDIPELRTLINAAGGKSAIAAIQKVGRGMRKAEGKTEVKVYDFNDEGNNWLERHTRQRIKSYVTEGYKTVVIKEDGTKIERK